MFKKYLQNSDFTKNTLTLVSGTAAAQIITLLFAPFLTRIFSPADFGLFAVFMSLTNMLSVIAGGRYDLAIMLPKDDEDSKHVVFLSTLIAFCVGILSLLIFYLFNKQITFLLIKKTETPIWLYFTSVVIFLIIVYQAFNYWLLRKKAFFPSSINKVVQTSSIGIISLAAGIMSYKYGLMLGYTLGWLIATLFAFFQSIRFGLNTKKTNSIKLIENAKKYIDFPKYNAIPALLNSISSSLPVFFITGFFNSSITGFFNLARQVLLVPVSFLSYSLSQAYFERLVSKRNEGQPILKDFLKIVRMLGLISIITIAGTEILGPFLFGLVFGKEWIAAGEFARLIVLSCAIQFIVSPLSIAFPALEKIKIGSYWQAGYFCLISLLYFGKDLSFQSFLILYIGIDFISYSIYFAMIYHLVSKHDQNLLNK